MHGPEFFFFVLFIIRHFVILFFAKNCNCLIDYLEEPDNFAKGLTTLYAIFTADPTIK